MFKNYLIVAFRNFRRNKVFSLINIAGLVIGISAAVVIFMIVHYELSFEKFQKDRNLIFRVVTNMHFPDQDFKNSGVPGPLPDAMRNEIAGIEKSTVFWVVNEIKVAIPVAMGNEKVFKKQGHVIYADEDYFSFFPYQWLAGSPENALNAPNQVVLAESVAKIYFSFSDIRQALGQAITYGDSIKAIVIGIVKDLDETTDFTFTQFISLSTISESLKANSGWNEWGGVNSASQFFIKLKKGIEPEKINNELGVLRKKHKKNEYLRTDHFLQPLGDIHFDPDFDNFDQRQGHRPTLKGLIAVAVFLLLLGCINFINLTTAQAANRAKEIGIRKTMGSSKKHIIFQFLSETFLLTFIATLLSVGLIPLILKLFTDYIPGELRFDPVNQPHIIIFLIGLVFTVSFLSGFYPAFVLSRFKPVLVLKNLAFANTGQSRRTWIRKTLTISQFVIAQFFIIATLMVGKQMRLLLNKDMGFKKDAIINFRIPLYDKPDNKQFVLQGKLKAIPEIERLSLAGSPPASSGISISTLKFNKDGKEIETSVETKNADTAYFSLYNIKLLAGRPLQQSDTTKEYVINNAYAKFLGYNNPADIIGQSIVGGSRNVPIVGVIDDIHTKSLHQAIKPLAFTSRANSHSTFHIALGSRSDAWKKTIAKIEKAWKEVYPEEEFNYSFFDESIAEFYKKEQQTAKLLNWSAGLAVFISCLGLLGLVIYTTSQRTKEIGVRKVLGATVTQIVSLLSKDFMQLVALAFVIATPLAWWAMYKWLEDFAYRTTLSWWVFGISGVSMLVIALLTLSIQTIRSAVANPVTSLRTE